MFGSRNSHAVSYDEKSIPPPEWFMDISELNSEKAKKYMDPDARLKMIRTSLEYLIKEKENERKKK